jgi:hypothetical protein
LLARAALVIERSADVPHIGGGQSTGSFFFRASFCLLNSALISAFAGTQRKQPQFRIYAVAAATASQAR